MISEANFRTRLRDARMETTEATSTGVVAIPVVPNLATECVSQFCIASLSIIETASCLRAAAESRDVRGNDNLAPQDKSSSERAEEEETENPIATIQPNASVPSVSGEKECGMERTTNASDALVDSEAPIMAESDRAAASKSAGYVVYLLQSTSTKRSYVGMTNNLGTMLLSQLCVRA